MNPIASAYLTRHAQLLQPLARALEQHLKAHVGQEKRIDSIRSRAKSPSSFLEKAGRQRDGQPKYNEPLRQIQDQVGARIVTYYSSDVQRVASIVEKYYRAVESRDLVPESEW